MMYEKATISLFSLITLTGISFSWDVAFGDLIMFDQRMYI